MDKISQTGAEWNADCGDIWSKAKPEVELQWRTFGFRNRKSQPRTIVITMKFDLLTETDIRKRAMSPDLKPEVKLRRSGRHLENRYNIIYLR